MLGNKSIKSLRNPIVYTVKNTIEKPVAPEPDEKKKYKFYQKVTRRKPSWE